MRDASRTDALVALGLVLAAITEAVLRYREVPGLLALNATGALWLGSLAVRRSRPVLPIVAISVAGVTGSMLTAVFWPDAAEGAGVWIFAMMFACYSLGAHAIGRTLVLGLVLPLAVVGAADLFTRSGWDRASGIVFVSLFVGLLPTVVGRLVQVRSRRLGALREQHHRIVQAQRGQAETAVLAERLRTSARLQPTLTDGLRRLAAAAEAADDAATIEVAARRLLTRTREEVLALTAPVATPVATAPEPGAPPTEPQDHLRALRDWAQPWTVMAGAAVTAVLAVESSRVLDPSLSMWLVVPASLCVGAPLALACWRPVTAIAVSWAAAAAYSRLVTPLDGTLSEAALALTAAVAVAALSTRRLAVAGLLVCLAGQVLGVGTEDPFGVAVFMLLCWLGGLAVNDVATLVEQTRANNAVLERQQSQLATQAVVEERFRLAREIHDAVGHSLTVVALQAAAARRVANTDAERYRQIMHTIVSAARGGVVALALGDAGPSDIIGLVERVRAAGLEVETDLAGVDSLAPEQRQIAFRVVQEGLTNVLRHAPGARAAVAVRPDVGGVEVLVTNSAPAVSGASRGTGRGLVGIRERVSAVAGQATWGVREDAGFQLRALLPAMSTVADAR